MRRVAWLTVLAIVAVAVIVAILNADSLRSWLAVHTGTVNESGPWYGFWSGFGSDLGEVAMIGGLITVVRHLNCHEHGCWRLGRHTTTEGYKLCRTHVAKPKDALDLHEVHADHLP